MLRRVLVALLVLLSVCSKGIAQDRCYTDEKYREMVQAYPGILDLEREFEAQIRSNAGGVNVAGLNKTTISATDTSIIDIPIVIHIVHDYGAEYLSDNVIYEAAKYWADVYMCQNADTSTVIDPFKKWVGNPRIRLHLATIDPNGKPTKGVVRHRSYLTSNADDQAKYNQWAPNKYINVWFIRQFGASATGAAAYAIYPSTAVYQPYADGIIGLYSYANYDKAIPHEFGHVLNLSHPWGSTNSPDVACGDDNVDDTPPTKGHNPVGCIPSALYDVTCAGGYLRHYTSRSGGDSIVDYPDTTNAQNIMDYTYCQRMFTKGQVVRMRTAMLSSTAGRNNLFSASNLAATGALAAMPDLKPVADYSVERSSGGGVTTDSRCYFLAANSPANFNFYNRSWNDTVTRVDWSFSNGATTPTASSLTAITNHFSVPGWVTVTQLATSNAGTDTLVRSNAVFVADTQAAGGSGYVQHFADAASVSNWPMFNFFENQYKWQLYSGVSSDGDNSCIKYRSRDTTNKRVATPAGDHDDFYTPAFNLAGVTGNFYLNFMTAAASSPAPSGFGAPDANADSLEIDASTSGGVRWTRIGGISGTTLANNGAKSSEFTPTSAGQWIGRSIPIPATYRTANTFLRFRYWPGTTGNNFYMDDLHLSQFPVGISASELPNSAFKIFPNPATSAFSVIFNPGMNGAVHLIIRDLAGKVVFERANTYSPGYIAQETLQRDDLPAPGLYFVSMVIDGNTATEKLVVY